MNMKLILLTATILAGALAFGAANDTILTFSTQGPDTYGDGTTVLDGERYALVWVKDGTAFAGLTADCKPLAETTKVIAVAPLAKGGKCPETVFEIDAEFAETLKGGGFALYLLDTRVSKTELSGAAGVRALPTSVNAVGSVIRDSSDSNDSIAAAGGVTSVKAGAVSLAEVGVYTEVAAPKIAAMRIMGAKVELKVEGMVENHDYFVVPGSSPSDFMPALATEPAGDTFIFDAPKGAPFFKVIGARKFR